MKRNTPVKKTRKAPLNKSKSQKKNLNNSNKLKSLLSRRSTLVAFVVIFAAVGAFMLYRSMANTPFPTSRNVYEWPFARNSVWNMPIGSNAVYKPAGLLPVTQAKAQGGITVDLKYLALDPSAPVKTLVQGDYTNHPKQPSTNKPNTSAIGTKIRVPSSLTADGKLNGAGAFIVEGRPLEIVEANRTWIEPSGSDPRAMYSFSAKNLKGNGWEGGPGGGQQGSVGGTIRKGEMTRSEPIRHALRLNVWGSRFLSRKTAGGCNEGYRWPAIRADANYNQDPSHGGSYNGTVDYVCMGTLLAIKPDQDISWITSNKVKKIAEAARDYGMYIVDNTAWDVWGLNVESSAADELMKADIASQDTYFQEMQKLILSLNAVTNNSPESIGGGGAPRAPLAPCFKDEPNCPATTQPVEEPSAAPQVEGKLEKNENFTQGVKAVASSQISDIFNASKAIDGDETSDQSRWTSARNDGETLTLDLGKELTINRIAFISAKNTTKQYNLLISTDNVSYQSVAQGITVDGTTTLNDKVFQSKQARYIRFQGLNRWNTNYGHSVFEIAAYIDKNSTQANFELNGVSTGTTVKRWVKINGVPTGTTGAVSFKYYVKGKEIYSTNTTPYCLGAANSSGACRSYDLKNANTQGKETFILTVKMNHSGGTISKDYTLTRE